MIPQGAPRPVLEHFGTFFDKRCILVEVCWVTFSTYCGPLVAADNLPGTFVERFSRYVSTYGRHVLDVCSNNKNGIHRPSWRRACWPLQETPCHVAHLVCNVAQKPSRTRPHWPSAANAKTARLRPIALT